MNKQSSYVSTNEYSQKITDASFFDKVINLQFFKRNSKSGERTAFTIRSDYEMITNSKGEYYFARMPIKPDIRVQYKQVAKEVAIQIYVHITNFRTVTPEGVMQNNFTVAKGEEVIEEIHIEMGYFGQMPDFTNKYNNLTKDDYFNLDKSKGRGTKILKGKIIAVYPTKLPPNGVTTFMLSVANVENSIGVPAKMPDAISYKDYFFLNFTKRALKPGVPEVDEKKILARNESMTDEEANKYGVKILCSKGVLVSDKLKSPPDIPPFDSILEGLELFQTLVDPNVRFFPLPTGDFCARFQDEPETSAIRSADYLRYLDLQDDVQIPAIDSIELGATASITCPFFGIIYPFQKISFQSYFNLASFVNYYLPGSNVKSFLPISCEIDFSTNGKENSIKMQCVRGEE